MARPVKTVLVTGGAGYVGSVLVPLLRRTGYQVRVVDLFLFQDESRWRAGNPGVDVIRGDIRDADVRRRAVRGADAVVHLAAVANDVDSSPELRDPTYEINLGAVKDLVNEARDAGVGRFVNASSATVYGVKDEVPVTEEAPPTPITLYGRLKAESEEYAIGRSTADFAVVSLRSATVCGPSPRQRLDLTVNILTHHAAVRGVIQVHGGQQVRPNVHIDDLARAYLACLAAPVETVAGRAFNVVHENHPVGEIAGIVRSVVAEHVTTEVLPVLDRRSYHLAGDRFVTCLDFTFTKSVRQAAAELAQSFAAGAVPDPDRDRYHNLQLMRNRGFR